MFVFGWAQPQYIKGTIYFMFVRDGAVTSFYCCCCCWCSQFTSLFYWTIVTFRRGHALCVSVVLSVYFRKTCSCISSRSIHSFSFYVRHAIVKVLHFLCTRFIWYCMFSPPQTIFQQVLIKLWNQKRSEWPNHFQHFVELYRNLVRWNR